MDFRHWARLSPSQSRWSAPPASPAVCVEAPPPAPTPTTGAVAPPPAPTPTTAAVAANLAAASPTAAVRSVLSMLPTWGLKVLTKQQEEIRTLQATIAERDAEVASLRKALRAAEERASDASARSDDAEVVAPVGAVVPAALPVVEFPAEPPAWQRAEALALALDALNWVLGEGTAFSRRAFWREALPRAHAMLAAIGEEQEQRCVRAAAWRLTSEVAGGEAAPPAVLQEEVERARDRVNQRLGRICVPQDDDLPSHLVAWLATIDPALPPLPLSLCEVAVIGAGDESDGDDDGAEPVAEPAAVVAGVVAPEGTALRCVNDTEVPIELWLPAAPAPANAAAADLKFYRQRCTFVTVAPGATAALCAGAAAGEWVAGREVRCLVRAVADADDEAEEDGGVWRTLVVRIEACDGLSQYGYMVEGDEAEAEAEPLLAETKAEAAEVEADVKVAEVKASPKLAAPKPASPKPAAPTPAMPRPAAPEPATAAREIVRRLSDGAADFGSALRSVVRAAAAAPAPAFAVGGRCVARAPVDPLSFGDSEEQWVPGRVLAERTVRGGREIKVSLDGYDSEADEWVTDAAIKGGALRPYDGESGGAEAAAKRDAEERDAARRGAEERKSNSREEAAAAVAAAAAAPMPPPSLDQRLAEDSPSDASTQEAATPPAPEEPVAAPAAAPAAKEMFVEASEAVVGGLVSDLEAKAEEHRQKLQSEKQRLLARRRSRQSLGKGAPPAAEEKAVAVAEAPTAAAAPPPPPVASSAPFSVHTVEFTSPPVRPGLLRAMPLQDLSGGNNRPAPTQAPLATKPAVDLNMTTASWDAPLPFARAGKRLTRTGCSTPACRLLDQYMAGATDQPVITPDLECD